MSKLFDDSSLAMIPSAVKDGKLYSIRPTPEYGSELVVGGDFSSSIDWNVNPNWTISGGKAIADGTSSNDANQSNNLPTIGKSYLVVFTVSNYVSGDFKIAYGGVNTTLRNANGTYSEIITAQSTDRVRVGGVLPYGSVDNVSVKEVLVNGDFTFSRGSNLAATRVDVNGLIEKGRENVFTYSQDFRDVAGWLVSNATKESISETDPNGGSTAANITWTAGSGRYFYKNITQGNLLTASFYIKSNGGGNKFRLFGDGANDLSQDFTATSEWQRFEFFFTRGSGQGTGITNASDNSAADLLIAFGQLEQGLVATDYIETGASTAQAGILEDLPRLDYSGGASCPSLLLEPQRTNIITDSEYFGSADWYNSGNIYATRVANATTSPDGLRNAYSLEGTGTTGRIQDYIGNLSGSYTHSIFLKGSGVSATANLQSNDAGGTSVTINADGTMSIPAGNNRGIEYYGNGWYRIYFTYTATAGTQNYFQFYPDTTGNGAKIYCYGAQVEAGSYPTSYIPTNGSAVTRSYDVCKKTNIDSLIAEEGTAFIDVTNGDENEVNAFMTIADSSVYPDHIWIGQNGTTLSLYVKANDSYSVLATNIVSIEGRKKIAVVYTNESIKVFVNGTNEYTTLNKTLPSQLNRVELNAFNTSINTGTARYDQAVLFPTALTDSECIALTTI